MLLPNRVACPAGACRFPAASPLTPLQHPVDGGALHEASTRVQAIHPSGHSPRLRPPGRNEPPLGLSPELRTPPTRSRRRTPGWGQAIEHGPGTTRSTSHQLILQSCSSLTTCDLVSHRHKRASRACNLRASARIEAVVRPGRRCWSQGGDERRRPPDRALLLSRELNTLPSGETAAFRVDRQAAVRAQPARRGSRRRCL